MASRDVLKSWLLEALAELGGSATVLEVCEKVWARHEAELRAAGPLFYSWQYDIRWAATKLRKEGKLAQTGRNEPWRVA